METKRLTTTNPGASIGSMKYMRPLLVFATAAIMLLSAIAGITGRINGFLKDAGGMPVQGAKLTLVDKEKGTRVTVTTDRKGSFAFPTVFPGAYKLQAEAAGFVSQERPTVLIHVDSALRIDLTLEAEKAKQ
jgi:hypothetical protein